MTRVDLTVEDCNAALLRVGDEEIDPELPPDVDLTIAPDHLDDNSAYVKRPSLIWYDTMKGTNFIPTEVLNETLTMENTSKSSHPNIVRYYGCRLRRGRITSVLLERHDMTLQQYVFEPRLGELDKDKFCQGVESAVQYLHGLGLAHNDIDPNNIMIKDDQPILIDFGSCQPVGKRLQSMGTPGWCDGDSHTSEKKRDTFSLGKLREWIQNPE
ncbi:hypothetical protein ACO1O0_003907 [Amphichorda felina]